MTTGKRRYILNWILFLAVLLIALVCREINEDRTLPVATLLGVAQTVLYAGLAVVWGVSVRRRIVQPQIRSLLECTGILVLVWFLARGIKYYALPFFDDAENIGRYLWYCYYFPMLCLPTVMVMTAFSLRKPESFRLPKRAIAALFSASSLLFLCVLTNDLHQLVFDFPADAAVFTDGEYGYGILYYLCLGWIIGCALTAFVVMVQKCRLPSGKKVLWVPLVPAALGGIYEILYITGHVSFFNDVTIVDCFLLIATLELSIAVGLIPSNMCYEALFRASDISSIITDEALSPIYISDTAVIPEKETMRKAVKNDSVVQNGMRLSAYAIGGGYSFLEEDVTELYEAIEELGDVRTELQEEYIVAREVYQTSRKRQSLVEKNRLYYIMQSETKTKTEALCALLRKLPQTDELSEKRALTAEIALYFAYLKRRNNLLFLKESSDRIRGDELVFCARESLDNFRLGGAETNLNADLPLDMSFRDLTQMYDAFEAALETALKETSELFVSLTQNGNAAVLHMNFVCPADLSVLAAVGFTVCDEGDDEWTMKYTVGEGGAPV